MNATGEREGGRQGDIKVATVRAEGVVEEMQRWRMMCRA